MSSEVFDSHASLQAVGTFHGYAAHSVFAYVLLDFKYERSAVGSVDFEGVVDGRNQAFVAVEHHVDNRADYL